MKLNYKFFYIFYITSMFVLKAGTKNSFSMQQQNQGHHKIKNHLFGSKLQNCNETSHTDFFNSDDKNNIVNENDNFSFQDGLESVYGKEIWQIYDKSLLLNYATGPLISPLCREHIRKLKYGIKKFDLWALKMLDSSARLPSGILNGNVNQYGDFDQCLEITDGKSNVKGQYCLAHLQLNINIAKFKKLGNVLNLVKSHEAFKSEFDDVGHRIPRFSMINWGICAPASCSPEDIKYSLNNFFRNFTNLLKFDFDVRVQKSMCQTNDLVDWNFSFVMIIAFFMFMLFIVIMSTFYDFTKGINKNEFLGAFSLRKNLLWLVDMKPCPDDVSTVHGIRFINAAMLLISHKSMAALFNPFVNRTYLAESLGKSWTVIGRAASLYTDPFLLISGMLTAYSILGRLERGRKISVTNEWITRLVRILPPVIALMLFCTFIMPKIGSGPQWNLVVGTHSDLCKSNWWRLLLFIQNYFGFREMCLTHTHHLGIDTELFFVCPFVILSLYKWPKNTWIILMIMICLGTAGRFYTSLVNELANYIYFGASIKQLFKTADFVYTFPPYRSSVYIMGVLLGYMLRKFKCVSLSKTQLMYGWISAFLCFSLTLILPSAMGEKSYSYNAIHAALYSAFAPLSWCSFFSWIIFVSHLGYKNFVTKILSWNGFLISTKLSYSLYLTQFPVFFYNVGRRRNADFYYNFTTIMIDLNEFLCILMCSVLLTLLFDAPFQNIKKLLWKR